MQLKEFMWVGPTSSGQKRSFVKGKIAFALLAILGSKHFPVKWYNICIIDKMISRAH